MFGIKQEPVQEAQTVEEMRAEINRLRRYEPLVRSVMDTADYNGMSSEDRFTILAYQALKQNSKLKEMCLEYNNTHITPMTFVKDGAG